MSRLAIGRRCGDGGRVLRTAAPVALCFAMISCASERAGRRSLGKPPQDAQPAHLVMGVLGKIIDSDENGFPDTIVVVVNVMIRVHPVPITPPGTFVFQLEDEDGTVLVRWELDEESTRAARRPATLIGPGYVFRLSILDKIPDAMPLTSMSLSATFLPVVGEPAESSGRKYVRFGRDRGY